MLFMQSMSFASPCDHPTSPRELLDNIEVAETAFNELQDADLLQQRNLIILKLKCVEEPLGADVIGGIHWIQALAALVAARPEDFAGTPDDSRTMAALAGLFDAQPAFQLPPSLPPEHTLRELILNANYRLADPAIVALPPPGTGRIEANTKPSVKIRDQVAAVLQQYDGDNNLLSTCYWWPGDPVTNCAQDLGLAPAIRAVDGEPAEVRDRKKGTLPWLLGGASLVVIGAGAGLEGYNTIYWKNNLEDCMGALPLFPGAYTGGACGFAPSPEDSAAKVAERNYMGWKTSWLGGLGLITAGTLGLVGSGVVVLTDGRQIVVSGHF